MNPISERAVRTRDANRGGNIERLAAEVKGGCRRAAAFSTPASVMGSRMWTFACASASGLKVTYVADSIIYHYGQSSPGRKDNEEENIRLFKRKWKGWVVPDLQDYLLRDGTALPPEAPRPRPAERIRSSRDSGGDIHFAVYLKDANAFT